MCLSPQATPLQKHNLIKIKLDFFITLFIMQVTPKMIMNDDFFFLYICIQSWSNALCPVCTFAISSLLSPILFQSPVTLTIIFLFCSSHPQSQYGSLVNWEHQNQSPICNACCSAKHKIRTTKDFLLSFLYQFSIICPKNTKKTAGYTKYGQENWGN